MPIKQICSISGNVVERITRSHSRNRKRFYVSWGRVPIKQICSISRHVLERITGSHSRNRKRLFISWERLPMKQICSISGNVVERITRSHSRNRNRIFIPWGRLPIRKITFFSSTVYNCGNSRYQTAYQEIWLNFHDKSSCLLVKKNGLVWRFSNNGGNTLVIKWDFRKVETCLRPLILQRALLIVFNRFSQVLS